MDSLHVVQAPYKYIPVLLGSYITFLLLNIALANRLILLNGFLTPGGIYIYPFTFILCDIVSEVYGYAMARKFIWIGAFCKLLFTMTAIGVVHLPSPTGFNNNAYATVFNPVLRFVIAGFIAVIIGEFINIYFLSKWKMKLQGRLFWLRSSVTIAMGQAIVSIIVDVLAFSNNMPWHSLCWMMVSGYFWKMIYTFLAIYPAWVLVKFLKKSENIDIYDYGINFNPFRLSEK